MSSAQVPSSTAFLAARESAAAISAASAASIAALALLVCSSSYMDPEKNGNEKEQ
jgi:hypothetical protein